MNKEELMQQLGLENLSQEKQNDILARIGEIILKKLFIETMETLEEGDRQEFERMLTDGSDAESIENFINKKIAHYDLMTSKVVGEVVDAIKNK